MIMSMLRFARANGLVTSQQYRSLRGQLNSSPFTYSNVAVQSFIARLGFSYSTVPCNCAGHCYYGTYNTYHVVATYNGQQID